MTMEQVRRALREEFDRVSAHLLFVVYGVLALVFRPESQSQTPPFFAILFNVEFIILGVLLTVGTVIQSYRMKFVGYTLYVIALVSMAGLILTVGRSPVSILILAFALRGWTSIRELQHGRQFIRELKTVLTEPSGDGDDRS
jgi:hypothetical protein